MQEVLNDEADDIKEELGLCFSVSTNESQVRVEMNGVVVVVAVVVWPCQKHVEVPGPGIEPIPQQRPKLLQ